MLKKWGQALGLVEEYDDEYDDLPEDLEPAAAPAPAPPPPPPRPQPSNVRRIGPAGGSSPSVRESSRAEVGYEPPDRGQAQTVRPISQTRVHVTNPATFNDVEEVGERFRNGVPVIMNLDGASETVAKRMLDFASGLIFGLDGRIERVGERVFLLTPSGAEVSTEERRRLADRGFFNQA